MYESIVVGCKWNLFKIMLSQKVEQRQNKILQGIILQTRDERFDFGLTKPQQLSKIKRRNPVYPFLFDGIV